MDVSTLEAFSSAIPNTIDPNEVFELSNTEQE